MSSPKRSSRSTLVRNVLFAVFIGSVLAFAVVASQGSVLAFVDSAKEFFGLAAVQITAVMEVSYNPALPVTPTATARPPDCTLSFGAATNFDLVRGQPSWVATGDLNNDGIPDMAVSNEKTSDISILLGTGAGGFNFLGNYPVLGPRPQSVAMADFNSDGNLDLAVPNNDSNSVSILLGTGNGTFDVSTNFAVGAAPHPIAIGDFNRDGKADIAVPNQNSNTVSILLGTGTGIFSPATDFPVGSAPRNVALGDFDGDGKLDIATANIGSGNVSILFGTGTGGFSPAINFPTGSQPSLVAVGDFNGDGKLDLAVPSFNTSQVSILLGTGTGSFSSATNYPTGSGPMGVTVADLNGDGELDLVTANSASTISILLGTGNGSFSAASDIAGVSPSFSVAASDLNGDNRRDLAVANYFGNSVSIILNTSPCVPTPTGTPTPTTTSTNTPTSTPTNTPTATPTAPAVISGTVTYGNAIPAATRFVSNVSISAAGTPPLSVFTDGLGPTAGQYSLTGFGSGSYTVTPSKSGAQNGAIGSFDAAKIAQHAAGTSLLTGNALIVADVSGTNGVTSFDAAEVARYTAGFTTQIGQTGNWIFQPANRNYASVTSDVTGQDYSGLLMGEVSGNWQNNGSRPAESGSSTSRGGPERDTAVALPRLVTPADSAVLIPVSIEGAADKGIISYEFDLRYDASVIRPQANPVDLVGTVSGKLSVIANAEDAGLLIVVVYGPMPIDGNGILLNLRFTAVGAPGSVSPLTWERFMFNEDPATTATDGQIELSAAAPNQAEISGRLLTAMGQGVANARVTLTGTSGQSRSILSNGFGVYRFGGLQVGQTYTVSVDSMRYRFAPLTSSITDQLVSVDMIAAP